MIHFIIGGFGGGKSYSGLRLIRSELLNGNRGICTNLAIDEKKFSKYLGDTYPKINVSLHQRLRILTDEEIGEFMLHRISRNHLWYDIPAPDKDAEKRGVRPDWSLLRDNGIFYVIEEAHEFFNSYQWQEIGRAFRAYKNQNRKFSDDIIFITPQITEIDKQLRISGQSYTQLINLGKKKIKGVRLPPIFLAREYSTIPDRNTSPMNSYTYGLDLKLADCYDTAKGVRGVQGGLADKERKTKGISWWLVLGVCTVITISFFFGPPLISRLIFKRTFGRGTHLTATTSPPSLRLKNKTEDHEYRTNEDVVIAGQRRFEKQAAEGEDVVCTGYTVEPKDIVVYLSDGRVARASRLQVQGVNEDFVRAFGKVYRVSPGLVAEKKPEYPEYPRMEIPPGIVHPQIQIQSPILPGQQNGSGAQGPVVVATVHDRPEFSGTPWRFPDTKKPDQINSSTPQAPQQKRNQNIDSVSQ